ncbi:MAG: histidine phosphatase family protein [Vicinamibacterales bacterium]|nr:histidine phosphatase family protein [Vicinamibacterales bacterium]
MYLFLVHHADALPPDVDHLRPLSSAGMAHAERVAAELKARGARPSMVWHSGKLRARQTAEACWRALNPLATFVAVRGLRPEDDPAVFLDTLTGEEGDVLAAGHMPNLPRLLHRLTGRSDFPQHGAVALERTNDGFAERWRVGGG